MPEPLRAVVADDSLLIRGGVVGVLRSGGIEVVAQGGDEEGLLRAVRAHRPDCCRDRHPGAAHPHR